MDHYVAGSAEASLVEDSVAAAFVADTVARSAGECALAEFGSELPNIRPQQEDQTVDSDRLHVRSSSLAHLFVFVPQSNHPLSLWLLLRHSRFSASC